MSFGEASNMKYIKNCFERSLDYIIHGYLFSTDTNVKSHISMSIQSRIHCKTGPVATTDLYMTSEQASGIDPYGCN